MHTTCLYCVVVKIPKKSIASTGELMVSIAEHMPWIMLYLNLFCNEDKLEKRVCRCGIEAAVQVSS